MQVSKRFLMVCTTVLCAGSISLGAPDTLSQAQAREALRKKIAELNAQEAATETSAPQATDAEKKARPAPAPQPVVQPPPVTLSPAPSAPVPAAVVTAPAFTTPQTSSSSEETARQREAVRRKLAELDAQEVGTQTAPPPAATTSAVKSPKEKSAAVIKAEKEAAAAEERRLVDEAKAKQKAEAEAQFKPAAFAPLEAPPPAVPASKEAKLADLLRRYKAEEISPEDYHTQRAKILAEP